MGPFMFAKAHIRNMSDYCNASSSGIKKYSSRSMSWWRIGE